MTLPPEILRKILQFACRQPTDSDWDAHAASRLRLVNRAFYQAVNSLERLFIREYEERKFFNPHCLNPNSCACPRWEFPQIHYFINKHRLRRVHLHTPLNDKQLEGVLRVMKNHPFSITSLELVAMPVGSSHLVQIAQLRGLKTLMIHENRGKLNEMDWNVFSMMDSLESLTLIRTMERVPLFLDNHDFQSITTLKGLRHLTIADTWFWLGDEVCTTIAKAFPQLETLVLPCCKISDEGVKALKDLKFLNSLTLLWNHKALTERAGEYLAALPLQSLTLLDGSSRAGKNLMNVTLWGLKGSQTLRELTFLTSSGLTNVGVAYLWEFPHLTSFSCDGITVLREETKSALMALKQKKGLKVILKEEISDEAYHLIKRTIGPFSFTAAWLLSQYEETIR